MQFVGEPLRLPGETRGWLLCRRNRHTTARSQGVSEKSYANAGLHCKTSKKDCWSHTFHSKHRCIVYTCICRGNALLIYCRSYRFRCGKVCFFIAVTRPIYHFLIHSFPRPLCCTSLLAAPSMMTPSLSFVELAELIFLPI